MSVAQRNVTEVTHPLARHKLGLLREKTTSTADFRRLVDELTLLLTYEATKDFHTELVEVETPLERTTARRKYPAGYKAYASWSADARSVPASSPRLPVFVLSAGGSSAS